MTAAKENNNTPASFKSASLDQIWSCLQRCLLFEDPSSRWEKLVAQVARHANGKVKDFAHLPLAYLQQSFKTVFGTPDDLLDLTSRTFNLVLAIQDLRRFENADYDVWFLSQSNDDDAVDFAPIFSTIGERVLGVEPSLAQVASLWQAWNVVPYWRLLESNGPWSDEPLAEFAATLLHRLDHLSLELSAESLLAAEAEFNKLMQSTRLKLPNNFMPSLLVLVEGVTETILLPRFLSLSLSAWARQSGSLPESLSDSRALFIACGGANQLLRKYLHLRDVTKLPILCVMDQDVAEQSDTIREILRDIDQLHIWRGGEIEDTFAHEILTQSLNSFLQTQGVSELLLPQDLQQGTRRTELLDRLWRNRGLGDFDKVGFAEFHVGRIKHSSDIPEDGRRLMEKVKQLMIGLNGD